MYSFVKKAESTEIKEYVEAMKLNGSMFDAYLMKSWLESAGFVCYVAPDMASLIIDEFFTAYPGMWVVYTPDVAGIGRMTEDDFSMTYARNVKEVVYHGEPDQG